jgi:hypothetical protein
MDGNEKVLSRTMKIDERFVEGLYEGLEPGVRDRVDRWVEQAATL